MRLLGNRVFRSTKLTKSKVHWRRPDRGTDKTKEPPESRRI